MDSKRLANTLNRDLFVLEDESNPRGSKADQILPSTILDQVYDDQSPTHENLRQIIENLKQEILTGGRGNIVFPVTSVNGKTEDVNLTKVDLGLGRVDNTADVDKPLSTPQRSAIYDILAGYNFNVNLQDLHDHLMDMDNPHKVTIDQLNSEDELERYINVLIGKHNLSTNAYTHLDIRRSLSMLWTLVDDINNSLEGRLANILKSVDDHLHDQYAHEDILNAKEDTSNKMVSLTNPSSIDHIKYPTTRAVVEYVAHYATQFRETLPDVNNWIDDIQVVDSQGDLPPANINLYRKTYLIRYGAGSYNEIAICRHNPDGTYSWDISHLGSYSRFNSSQFVDTPDGLSLDMGIIVDAILSENGALDISLSTVLSDYYNRDDIDQMHLVNSIKIVPGTQNGTIRYYINDDMTTMSTDIAVAGLKRLAYLEWISESELSDNAVMERHIRDYAIETRHIQPKAITLDKLNCTYGSIIGNTLHADGTTVNEITLPILADMLRPLIGGWPDPNVPGGNPYYEVLFDQIIHPQSMTTELEYDLQDKTYAMRFKGEISTLPNTSSKILLTDKLFIGPYRIIEAGGSWCYQSDPEEWSVLGGSNLTGHTYGTVIMTATGTYFESLSIGDRMHAKYDVWIKYVKTNEVID